MTDLKVDGAVLAASERTLASLKSDFDGIEQRRDTTRSIWGHDAVADAMHEFASNMDRHRRRLSEEIATVGEKVSATLEAWDETDSQLADSLTVER
jgi:uncharacterized protein Yka (UPF0111/DUF47 family)